MRHPSLLSRHLALALLVALILSATWSGSVQGGLPAKGDQSVKVGPNYGPGYENPGPYAAYLAFSPRQSEIGIGDELWIDVLLIGNWPDNMCVKISFDPALLALIPTAQGAFRPGSMHTWGVEYWAEELSPGLIQYCTDVPSPGDASLNFSEEVGTWQVASFGVQGRAVGSSALTFVDGYWGSEGIVAIWWFTMTGASGSVAVVAATATPTPTSTPTPTGTPLARMLHGTVRDAANAPVAGAALTLYRNTGAWIEQAQGTSGSDGVFRLFTNPIPGDYKLVMTPPPGYAAQSAQLPAGLTGSVVAPDTVVFTLGSAPGQVGPFAFALETLPTATPTPSPQPTLPPAVLQGTVWLDANGDGVRQPEEGLAGVDVTITSGGLTAVYTTTTDEQGHYSLAVEPGEYTLALHDPQGRLPDQQREVDTEAVDPGPIDWGNHQRWLPMIWAIKP